MRKSYVEELCGNGRHMSALVFHDTTGAVLAGHVRTVEGTYIGSLSSLKAPIGS